MACEYHRPSAATGVLVSTMAVLFNSFLFALYELLGLIYFSFDFISWFSVLTGLVCVLSAILTLIGRDRESIHTLAWAFIGTGVSLGSATLMTSFLVILQAQVSTTRETRALSILRIVAMYFFAVLLPLSWMTYEGREFAVMLLRETDEKTTTTTSWTEKRRGSRGREGVENERRSMLE